MFELRGLGGSQHYFPMKTRDTDLFGGYMVVIEFKSVKFHCNLIDYFRFESCWPAMARETTGIIFVFNPDQPNHDKDLENW